MAAIRRWILRSLGLSTALLILAVTQYGNPSAEAVIAPIYVLPFEGTPSISCGYGCYTGHQGVDYELGTPGVGHHPVLAARRGTAKPCNFSTSAGWYIVLDHGSGHRTRYLHFEAAPLPAAGALVATGRTIGFEGTTGNSSDEHLHFETRHGATTFTCGSDGTAVNPYSGSTYMWVTNPPSARTFDLTLDSCGDIVGRKITGNWGDLVRYQGTCSGSVGGAIPVSGGWQVYDRIFGSIDFNGDGCTDILARESVGNLYRYEGNCLGGVGGRILVSGGWQVYDRIFAPGDFNGDGCADLIARTNAGILYRYNGNCAGGVGGAIAISGGWQVYNILFGAGDFSGDGCVDLIGRTVAGNLYRYQGDCAGGVGGAILVSGGWQVYDRIVGPGDFNGGSCSDILARTSAGNLYRYSGTCTGGVGAATLISGGWQVYDQLFAP